MSATKFKEIYKAEKKRQSEKQAFRDFQKQLKKLDKNLNQFESKYL